MRTLTLILIALAALLAACAPQATPQPTDNPTVPPTTAPSDTPAPTATQPAPAATNTIPPIQPSATNIISAVETPELLTTQPSVDPELPVMFMIALEDNGQSGPQVGCGDSLVPVRLNRPPLGTDTARYALDQLLAQNDQFYGESGLYNALYQSDLAVEHLEIANGMAVLNLTGTMRLGGVCDNPRFQAQLEETILANSDATEVMIFVNQQPLEDLLSGQ